MCAARSTIYNLIDGLGAVQPVLGQPNTADRLDGSSLQKRFGMFLSDAEIGRWLRQLARNRSCV
jgi:hypothetical protein